jgi:hypothetical protein
MKKKITDQELEKLMASSQPEFRPFFSTRVLAKLERYEDVPVIGFLLTQRLLLKRYVYAGAFCLALLLGFSYMQDGNLSLNHLLGLGNFSDDDILNYINPVI